MKRVVSIWLPRFTTDYLTKINAGPRQAKFKCWRNKPFATVFFTGGVLRVTAVNIAAEAASIVAGLSLADAHAIVPNIKVTKADPADYLKLLDSLVAWCRCFTPWTAAEGIDNYGGASIWLDITGCAHLFGGENALAVNIRNRLERLGFTSQLGLADTPGAAWAAARFVSENKQNDMRSASGINLIPKGAQRQHLAKLPVAALRLDLGTLNTLARLGLRNIDELLNLPRGPLVRRFGPTVVRRLDQLLGHMEETLSPGKEPRPYLARIAFAEPISQPEQLTAALTQLTETICKQLEKNNQGARQMEIEIFRIDATAQRIKIGTSRPLRLVKPLTRLFCEKVNKLDAGFGIEAVVVTALLVEPLPKVQERLSTETRYKQGITSEHFALLVDRLKLRLGSNNLYSLTLRNCHLPEGAMATQVPFNELRKDQSTNNKIPLSNFRQLRPGTRPIMLLPRPERIKPSRLELESSRTLPFLSFEWQKQDYDLVAFEGPERIAGEWWHRPLPVAEYTTTPEHYNALSQSAGAVRDYWRVETVAGERLWLFCFPSCTPGEKKSRWFVHGLFA